MKSLFKLLVSLLVKLAFIAMLYTIVMNLTACNRSDKPVLVSFSSESTQGFEVCTEPSEETVITETCRTEETSAVPTEESVTETSAEAETSAQQSKANPKKAQARKATKAPTKAPKKAVSKKAAKATNTETEATTAKATTKKPTKAPTKKPTSTPTPKPYTYCTCDAEVSCGSTAAGTFQKFTLKGLTAGRTKSGSWALTEASEHKVMAYVKEKYPSCGGYGVGKLKNKRDYRYKP